MSEQNDSTGLNIDPVKLLDELARCERLMGDQLAMLNQQATKLDILEAELGTLRSQSILKTADIAQELAKIMARQEANSMARNKTLTELFLVLVAKDGPPEKLQALLRELNRTDESKAWVGLLSEIEATELLHIPISKENQPVALKMESKLVDLGSSAPQRWACRGLETSETGPHGLRFKLQDTPPEHFRSVTIEVKEAGTPCLRLLLRMGKDREQTAGISIDLHDGGCGSYQNSNALATHEVQSTKLEAGWWRFRFNTRFVQADDSLEVLVLSARSLDPKGFRHAGLPDRGFLIRYFEFERRKVARKAPAQPEKQSPDQQRAALRRNYLDSGEYSKIAALRGLHRGRRAFLIGNGPSLKAHDLTALKHEITFVTNWFVNHPECHEIDPKYYCVSSHEMFGGWRNPSPCVNAAWYERMQERCKASRKFFSFRFRDYLQKETLFPGEALNYLLFDRPKFQIDEKNDINLDLSQPMDDGYTGILTFCMPLAFHMGISRIYLLGCDSDYGLTGPDSPKQYFYNSGEHKTNTTSYEGLSRAWAPDGPAFASYEIARRRLELEKVEIVNCTTGGKLEVFPRQSLESVLSNQSPE